MKILRKPNEKVLKLYSGSIDKLKSMGGQRRLHRYVLFLGVDDGTLLYNSMTGECVLLEDGDNLFSDYFMDNLWLLPDGMDDVEMVKSLKVNLFNSRPKEINPVAYTIATTTDCNARCFYCYEKNVKKKGMSEETARDVVEFIAKNYFAQKEDKRGNVTISWFGGEPLFNKKVISIICNGLFDKGVPFTSTMISNGYLFDENTVNDAVLNWHLKSVQITLDGTEEYYNKAKNYIHKGTNPFKTVTDNIELLADNGVHVTIRINVGYYNVENVSELVQFIKERYKGKTGISVYAHVLFDGGGVTDINTEEKDVAVHNGMMKINGELLESGLGGKFFFNSLKPTHCMADNGNHLVIQTDGGLCLCEHFVDSMRIGTIYDDTYDQEMIEKYREIKEPFKECMWCQIFPECSTLNICEDSIKKCGKARQMYSISKVTAAMSMLYKNYKEKLSKDGENGGKQVEIDGAEAAS